MPFAEHLTLAQGSPPAQLPCADQLKSIRYCVQETCNFDVLYAVRGRVLNPDLLANLLSDSY